MAALTENPLHSLYNAKNPFEVGKMYTFVHSNEPRDVFIVLKSQILYSEAPREYLLEYNINPVDCYRIDIYSIVDKQIRENIDIDPQLAKQLKEVETNK